MTVRLFPAQQPLHGDAEQFPTHERSRVRAAAHHARRVYPGPLGELAHRELSAYAEFGYRFAADALIPQLVAEILAMPAPERESAYRSSFTRTDAGDPGAAARPEEERTAELDRGGVGHDEVATILRGTQALMRRQNPWPAAASTDENPVVAFRGTRRPPRYAG